MVAEKKIAPTMHPVADLKLMMLHALAFYAMGPILRYIRKM